jgi:alkylation response protein AidB-like acyl-CoA dehydrogenase
VEDHLLGERRATAAVLFGPSDARPAVSAEPLLPRAPPVDRGVLVARAAAPAQLGELRRERVREPRANLTAKRLFLIGESEIHGRVQVDACLKNRTCSTSSARMDLAFTAEQEELRGAARRFLAGASSSARVRTAMESDRGWEPEVWRRLTEDLGWAALLVPEDCGGAGAEYTDLVAVFEEAGRSLLCAPLFSTVALATSAILVAGGDADRRRWLPAIADGRETATLAHAERCGRRHVAGDAIFATARADASGFVLTGEKDFVVDGHTASRLVVAARAPGTSGDAGVDLFVVDGGADGVERRALPTLDLTRKLATVTLRDVRVPPEARLGEPGSGALALRKTLDLARIALAAEQLGGAQRCLDMSVEYAKVRTQFGRPIGSFQAIKHACADMFVAVETARSVSYYAGCIASENMKTSRSPHSAPPPSSPPSSSVGPSSVRGDGALALAASMAKAACSDAFFRCAADAIQVHGGVGFTWEHDAHLYFKRARASEAMLGDAAFHREVIARGIGL